MDLATRVNGLIGYIDKTTNKRYYYVKDHLGSIRQIIHKTADYGDDGVVAAKNYQPYGSIIAEYNNATDYRYDFTEKERDKETTLHYFGARYYDSGIGRWTTADPLGDKYPGWSPYAYTLCNPLRFIDPNGMDTLYFDKQGKYLAEQTRQGEGEHVGYYTDSEGNLVQFAFNDQSDVIGFYKGIFNSIDLKFSNKIAELINKSGVKNVNGVLAKYGYALTESQSGGEMDFMTYNAIAGNKKMLKLVGSFAYNSNDAGNYVWGKAMQILGIPYKHAVIGAHMYEFSRGNWYDQKEDQNAIFRGYFGF